MASSSQKYSDNGLNLILFKVPQNALLQVGTVTVLMALIGGKACSKTLQVIAQASEELFRGDRLPVLKFPIETESESTLR